MRRTVLVTAAAIAGLGSLTACGSSAKSSGAGSGGSTAAASSSATAASSDAASTGDMVMIKNFMFMPMTLNVKVGTKVTWMNTDSATHTVTASDKSFDSGDLAQNKSYSFTFTKAGTYSYICNIHQYMTATVVVS